MKVNIKKSIPDPPKKEPGKKKVKAEKPKTGEQTPAVPKGQPDLSEMTTETLKTMTLEQLREFATLQNIEWPKAANERIERMHLVRKIKEKLGIAGPKVHGGGRKPGTVAKATYETADAIKALRETVSDIHAAVQRIEKALS